MAKRARRNPIDRETKKIVTAVGITAGVGLLVGTIIYFSSKGSKDEGTTTTTTPPAGGTTTTTTTTTDEKPGVIAKVALPVSQVSAATPPPMPTLDPYSGNTVVQGQKAAHKYV